MFCLDFSKKHIVLRAGVFSIIALTAISIPDFEPIMSLIGGSTIALTTLVFPPLFYLIISANEKEDNNKMLNYNKTNLSKPKNIGIKRYNLLTWNHN